MNTGMPSGRKTPPRVLISRGVLMSALRLVPFILRGSFSCVCRRRPLRQHRSPAHPADALTFPFSDIRFSPRQTVAAQTGAEHLLYRLIYPAATVPVYHLGKYKRRPHEHAHTDACVISFFVGPASAQRVAPHLTQNFLSAESLSPHLGQIFLPVTRLTDTSDLGCDLNRFIISSKSGSPLSSFAD